MRLKWHRQGLSEVTRALGHRIVIESVADEPPAPYWQATIYKGNEVSIHITFEGWAFARREVKQWLQTVLRLRRSTLFYNNEREAADLCQYTYRGRTI